MRKTLKASLGVAALAVIGTGFFASPANAASNGGPESLPASTVAPGGTVDVAARIWNGYSNAGISGSPTVTLTAPSHSHFEDGEVWHSNSVGAGAAGPSTYWNCPISADKKTITCGTLGMGLPAATAGWQYLNFAATVVVDSDAPYGQTFSDGVFTLGSNGDISGGTAALQYKVAAKPSAPQVTNVDQTSGSTVVQGTGQPGATVTIKDASGKTVGTGTVGTDGKFTIDIGATTGDVTLTQAANGVTSDPTTVTVVNTPVVNPAMAGGLGLAAAAAFGAVVLVRRKRATA